MTDSAATLSNAPFWLNDWRIDPDRGRISRGDEETRIEPKVMTVLQLLAQQPGSVVTREQLEASAWAGTVVGYDSLASTIIKLRKALGDDSRNPRYIETVPKKGYRLIATVSDSAPSTAGVQVTMQGAAAAKSCNDSTGPAQRRRLRLGWYALFGLMALAVVGIGYFVLSIQPGSLGLQATNAGRPSIAVLPFRNISNDPEQDYFSDGMTADLITDLSKISGLSVIARNSVFAYKHSSVDIRDIGEELGVAYIIEGSVRKAGDRVRISARLIDASNGYNLWADRFDSTMKNVFELQDEVTSKIINSLEIKLTASERSQIAHQYTDSIEAYDHFLHGWQHFWSFSRDGNLNARDYYFKAIELDPNFARAYANIALTYAYDYINSWSDDSRHAIEQATYYGQRAVELDDELPQVHWAMGLTYIFDRKYQQALAEAEKSIELDPNFADGYGLLATVLNFAARPREALVEMKKAMQLNPHYSFAYMVITGEIYFNLRDYPNAIDFFNRALERNPEAQEARLWLAAAYAHSGELDEAGWQLQHIETMGVKLSLSQVENVIPIKDPTQHKHLVDGLYKAGLRD